MPFIHGSDLKSSYDFIVCGAGSSGSVVARRIADNPAASVLLIEAGGDDQIPSITAADQWPANLGGERDWAFTATPPTMSTAARCHCRWARC